MTKYISAVIFLSQLALSVPLVCLSAYIFLQAWVVWFDDKPLPFVRKLLVATMCIVLSILVGALTALVW